MGRHLLTIEEAVELAKDAEESTQIENESERVVYYKCTGPYGWRWGFFLTWPKDGRSMEEANHEGGIPARTLDDEYDLE